MRLPRVRFTSWIFLIPLLIAADLFALWVWAARPRRIYLDGLGLGGLADEAPFGRIVDWARWQNGPRTPSGLLSLFELGDLFFAGVLLFAFVLLVAIPLAARQSESSLWRRLSAPIGWASAVAIRFRVRTALLTIAILGLYLGWEIHAWRTWRLRSAYLAHADQEAAGQTDYLARLRITQSMLSDLMTAPLPLTDYAAPEPGFYRSKAALLAGRAERRDRLEREIRYLSARITSSAAHQRKYERAAAHPSIVFEPDAPFPEQEPEAHDQLRRGPARSLAACDELARVYPDLVEAQLRSAWIRATCRDAEYRDGKRAVASATRACELTNWRDSEALSVLAAAFAESGEFGSAVKWQQKAMSLTAQLTGDRNLQEGLALYRAGKARRQK
jgi:hypothetical protein